MPLPETKLDEFLYVSTKEERELLKSALMSWLHMTPMPHEKPHLVPIAEAFLRDLKDWEE